MQEFHSHDATFAYHATNRDFLVEIANKNIGEKNVPNEKPIIIWAHGWGHTHQSWAPLIIPLENLAHHIVLDLPGFGNSPPPPDDWGTEDYADAIASWLKDNNFPPVLWIGHSFGCRIGIQIAARHPGCVKGMCLISGAGLKRKRALHKKIYFLCRINLFKSIKKFIPNGALKDRLINAFGSSDYKSAGALRKIFVRVVNEDLTNQAQKVKCPITLIYGKNDTETPPEFGKRFSQLFSNAKLFILDGQDHYSVFQSGRHQVIKILNDFIKGYG